MRRRTTIATLGPRARPATRATPAARRPALRRAALLPALLLAANAFGAEATPGATRTPDPRLAQTSTDLSQLIRSYRARLSGEQLASFDRAQREWEKYRESACRFEASGSAGGTAFATAYRACLMHLTEERMRYLQRLAGCEEGDVNCPVFRGRG